VEVNGDEMKEI